MSKSTVLVLLAAMLIIQNNCIFFDGRTKLPGGIEYREIIKIPITEEAERTALFNSYPVEKQIEIYLFAMIHQAPSNTSFEGYLKVNGERKIPKLVEAIDRTHSPNAKHNLISAIWDIDRNCNCVANDPAILERLKRAEPLPGPSDDRGDWLSKKGYSWVLFELQRKSPDKKDNAEIQNMPNPYSNSNTNRPQ